MLTPLALKAGFKKKKKNTTLPCYCFVMNMPVDLALAG